MTPIEAFLLATAAAYMAAALYSFLDKPPQQDIAPVMQSGIYIALSVILVGATFKLIPPLVMGAVGVMYGFLSVASFIGLQKWYAYWKENPEEGSAAGQIGMGVWDLALAVVFFLLY